MSDFGDYPRITPWGCPGDHGFLLLDLGPGAVDLVCEDPNCTYDPFESRPLSPLDEPVTQPQCEDVIARPTHYRQQVPGVEAWDILRHFSWLRGSAMKYLWRAGDKADIVQDLRKAIAFIEKEIETIEQERQDGSGKI